MGCLDLEVGEDAGRDEVDVRAVLGGGRHALDIGPGARSEIAHAAAGELNDVVSHRAVEIVLVEVGGFVGVAVEKLL